MLHTVANLGSVWRDVGLHNVRLRFSFFHYVLRTFVLRPLRRKLFVLFNISYVTFCGIVGVVCAFYVRWMQYHLVLSNIILSNVAFQGAYVLALALGQSKSVFVASVDIVQYVRDGDQCWRQCFAVDQNSTLSTIRIDRYCTWRNLDGSEWTKFYGN